MENKAYKWKRKRKPPIVSTFQQVKRDACTKITQNGSLHVLVLETQIPSWIDVLKSDIHKVMVKNEVQHPQKQWSKHS